MPTVRADVSHHAVPVGGGRSQTQLQWWGGGEWISLNWMLWDQHGIIGSYSHEEEEEKKKTSYMSFILQHV